LARDRDVNGLVIAVEFAGVVRMTIEDGEATHSLFAANGDQVIAHPEVKRPARDGRRSHAGLAQSVGGENGELCGGRNHVDVANFAGKIETLSVGDWGSGKTFLAAPKAFAKG